MAVVIGMVVVVRVVLVVVDGRKEVVIATVDRRKWLWQRVVGRIPEI